MSPANENLSPPSIVDDHLNESPVAKYIAMRPEGYGTFLSRRNPARILLHRSGEEYRPSWISDEGKEEPANPPQPITGRTVSLEIPAGEHIVIEIRD